MTRFSAVKGGIVIPDQPITVAVGQARCASLDVEANVATAARLVGDASAAGAALLVLPELFLSGYELEAIASSGDSHTISSDDARLESLQHACATHEVALVVGCPTRDGAHQRLHISSLVLSRDGTVAGFYHKMHVDQEERSAGVVPGTSGGSLSLDGWRFSLGICWDMSFPEHALAGAYAGAHGYLVSAMFDDRFGTTKRAILGPARALDNAFYVALANHCGPSGEFHGCGQSALWSPDGTLLRDAGTSDPGCVVAVFDPEALRATRSKNFVLTDPALGKDRQGFEFAL